MRATFIFLLLLITTGLPGHAESPANGLVVLQYHHISTSTPASTSISPEQFRAHMNWLADNGFTIVDLPAALEQLRQGKPLPDKTAAITFDDGYRNIYTNGFPILRERDWPFTIFVNTDPHDAGLAAWASWDELREMAAAGATLANHTASHLFMLRQRATESETAWLDHLAEEISRAQMRIKTETGQDHRLFAYPYGESNRKVRALVNELGYTAFGQQSGPIGPDSDFTDLPRFPLSGPYAAIETFSTKMLSLPMPIADAQPDSQSGDGTLRYSETQPELRLMLHDNRSLTLNCFASGQGAIPVLAQGNGRYVIRAAASLPIGRSRYNCTYASNQRGRFYWYSWAWV